MGNAFNLPANVEDESAHHHSNSNSTPSSSPSRHQPRLNRPVPVSPSLTSKYIKHLRDDDDDDDDDERQGRRSSFSSIISTFFFFFLNGKKEEDDHESTNNHNEDNDNASSSSLNHHHHHPVVRPTSTSTSTSNNNRDDGRQQGRRSFISTTLFFNNNKEEDDHDGPSLESTNNNDNATTTATPGASHDDGNININIPGNEDAHDAILGGPLLGGRQRRLGIISGGSTSISNLFTIDEDDEEEEDAVVSSSTLNNNNNNNNNNKSTRMMMKFSATTSIMTTLVSAAAATLLFATTTVTVVNAPTVSFEPAWISLFDDENHQDVVIRIISATVPVFEKEEACSSSFLVVTMMMMVGLAFLAMIVSLAYNNNNNNKNLDDELDGTTTTTTTSSSSITAGVGRGRIYNFFFGFGFGFGNNDDDHDENKNSNTNGNNTKNDDTTTTSSKPIGRRQQQRQGRRRSSISNVNKFYYEPSSVSITTTTTTNNNNTNIGSSSSSEELTTTTTNNNNTTSTNTSSTPPSSSTSTTTATSLLSTIITTTTTTTIDDIPAPLLVAAAAEMASKMPPSTTSPSPSASVVVSSNNNNSSNSSNNNSDEPIIIVETVYSDDEQEEPRLLNSKYTDMFGHILNRQNNNNNNNVTTTTAATPPPPRRCRAAPGSTDATPPTFTATTAEKKPNKTNNNIITKFIGFIVTVFIVLSCGDLGNDTNPDSYLKAHHHRYTTAINPLFSGAATRPTDDESSSSVVVVPSKAKEVSVPRLNYHHNKNLTTTAMNPLFTSVAIPKTDESPPLSSSNTTTTAVSLYTYKAFHSEKIVRMNIEETVVDLCLTLGTSTTNRGSRGNRRSSLVESIRQHGLLNQHQDDHYHYGLLSPHNYTGDSSMMYTCSCSVGFFIIPKKILESHRLYKNLTTAWPNDLHPYTSPFDGDTTTAPTTKEESSVPPSTNSVIPNSYWTFLGLDIGSSILEDHDESTMNDFLSCLGLLNSSDGNDDNRQQHHFGRGSSSYPPISYEGINKCSSRVGFRVVPHTLLDTNHYYRNLTTATTSNGTAAPTSTEESLPLSSLPSNAAAVVPYTYGTFGMDIGGLGMGEKSVATFLACLGLNPDGTYMMLEPTRRYGGSSSHQYYLPIITYQAINDCSSIRVILPPPNFLQPRRHSSTTNDESSVTLPSKAVVLYSYGIFGLDIDHRIGSMEESVANFLLCLGLNRDGSYMMMPDPSRRGSSRTTYKPLTYQSINHCSSRVIIPYSISQDHRRGLYELLSFSMPGDDSNTTTKVEYFLLSTNAIITNNNSPPNYAIFTILSSFYKDTLFITTSIFSSIRNEEILVVYVVFLLCTLASISESLRLSEATAEPTKKKRKRKKKKRRNRHIINANINNNENENDSNNDNNGTATETEAAVPGLAPQQLQNLATNSPIVQDDPVTQAPAPVLASEDQPPPPLSVDREVDPKSQDIDDSGEWHLVLPTKKKTKQEREACDVSTFITIAGYQKRRNSTSTSTSTTSSTIESAAAVVPHPSLKHDQTNTVAANTSIHQWDQPGQPQLEQLPQLDPMSFPEMGYETIAVKRGEVAYIFLAENPDDDDYQERNELEVQRNLETGECRIITRNGMGCVEFEMFPSKFKRRTPEKLQFFENYKQISLVAEGSVLDELMEHFPNLG